MLDKHILMVGLIEPKNVNSLDFIVSTSKMTIADQGETLREISSFGERLSLSKLPYKKHDYLIQFGI